MNEENKHLNIDDSKVTLSPVKKFKASTLIITASVLAVIGIFIVIFSFASTAKKMPSEFVARLYTEAYGRLPDQQGWNVWRSYFDGKGCSTETTAAVAKLVYSNAEFKNQPYTNQARLLALYRGVLSREPDASGYNYWQQAMTSGKSFDQVVDTILAGSEFKTLSVTICDSLVMNYPVKGTPLAIAGSSTGMSLQAKIDAAKPGSTVTIPRSELVRVSKRIILRRGITLTTQGNTGTAGRHASVNMARLVRVNPTNGLNTDSIVVLMPGSHLSNVWVDGQMTNHGTKDGSQNISVYPTEASSSVEYVRTDNPINGQNIILQGSISPTAYTSDISASPDRSCSGAISIANNLVINSANLHTKAQALWSDGIGTSCNNSVIHDNEVLDASDVGIIAYRAFGKYPQASQIYSNKILQAGNEAFGGIVADPLSVHFSENNRNFPECLTKHEDPTEPNCDFTGLVFRDNILWTGPEARFVIMASAGTKAWNFFNGCAVPKNGTVCEPRQGSATGTGATFTNNTTGISRANMQVPMYISAMHNVYARSNFAVTSLLDKVSQTTANPVNSCPAATTPILNIDYAAKTDPQGNLLRTSSSGYQLPDVGNGFRVGSIDNCIQ